LNAILSPVQCLDFLF